ncbi:MAG: hypothetical protein OHK0038_26580 [Flammeovirgaceae bacterium]
MDKLGLPFAIKVTEANLSDNEAGMQAFERLRGKVPRLQKIAVDSGNKDKFVVEARQKYGYQVVIVQKTRKSKRFCT